MVRLFLFVSAIGVMIGIMMPAPPLAVEGEATASAGAKKRSNPRTSAEPDMAAPVSNGQETRVVRSDDGHFYVHATVNGQRVRFLVDTGASAVALTVEDARRVGTPFSPSEFQVVGTGASGAVRGQPIELDRVELDGKEVSDVRGAVVEGLNISLLGQTFLSRMEMVQMSADEMVIR